MYPGVGRVSVTVLLARDQTGRSGVMQIRKLGPMMNWVLDIRPYCIGIMNFVVGIPPLFWTCH